MDLQEVLDKLEEANEEKNWDLVQEVIEQLIEMNLDNPFDGYDAEECHQDCKIKGTRSTRPIDAKL